MEHATKTIEIDGIFAQIDSEIVPLIRLINDIRGLSTFTCCQGYFDGSNDNFPYGYVMFLPDGKRAEARVVKFLTMMFQEMNHEWQEWLNIPPDQRKQIVDFEFDIDLGNGYAMHWYAGMYPFVYRAAERVAERMK